MLEIKNDKLNLLLQVYLYDINGKIIHSKVLSSTKKFDFVDVGAHFIVKRIGSYKENSIILIKTTRSVANDLEIDLVDNQYVKEVKMKFIWSQIKESSHKLSGIILNTINGGYSVGVSGYVAFLPRGQLDLVKDSVNFIGSVKKFSILNVNEEKKNIVLSRKCVKNKINSKKVFKENNDLLYYVNMSLFEYSNV